jgi:hypothetical protein
MHTILYYTTLYYTTLYYTTLYYTCAILPYSGCSGGAVACCLRTTEQVDILMFSFDATINLYSTTLYSTLYLTSLYPTLLYSTLPHSTLPHSTLPHSILPQSTLLYLTLLYLNLLYSTSLYSTLLHPTLYEQTGQCTGPLAGKKHRGIMRGAPQRLPPAILGCSVVFCTTLHYITLY